MLLATHRISRPVAFYLAASFFMGLANAIFDTVFNFYLAERGIHEADAGVIYAVATGVMAFAVVPLLLLSRFVSQKRLLIGAAVLYTAPFALLPYVSSVPAAAAVLSLILAGMLALLSVGNAIAGSLVSPAARTKLFSAFFVCYLGAGAAGSVLVSFLTDVLTGDRLHTYRILLFVAFACACVMLALRIPSAATASTAPDRTFRAGPLTGAEKRNLIALFTAASLLGASMALIFRFANIVFAQAYDLSVPDISLVLAGDKIVSIFGAIFAPLIVARSSARRSATVLGAVIFVGLITQSLMIPLIAFIALYLLRLLLNYGQMPVLDTIALTGFTAARSLMSTAVRQSSFYLGGAVAAGVYGRVLGAGHWQAALCISAGCALVGSLAINFVHDA